MKAGRSNKGGSRQQSRPKHSKPARPKSRELSQSANSTSAADSERHMKIPELFAAAAKGPSLAGRGLIQAYRYTFSAIFGRTCRHLPTCSEYGDEALARYGLWAGGWMTLARVARCHPWGTSGLDFVPDELPADAHWFLPWRFGRWRGVNAKK